MQEHLCHFLPKHLPCGKVKCDICTRSKSNNCGKLDPTDQRFEKLDVVITDIVGPFEVETFDHGKFLLTICDLATGYSEAKVMASKDLAGQLLIETINRWETQ
jgi:hypothetical protein